MTLYREFHDADRNGTSAPAARRAMIEITIVTNTTRAFALVLK